MHVTIHIGLPKCASSSLQGYFADNDALFRNAGLLYPVSHRQEDGYRHHDPLLASGLDVAAAADDILQEAGASGCRHVLLSAEQFSSDRTGKLAAVAGAFADRLSPDAVSCLCLIRDPVAMLRSSYQQFVRAGLWRIDRQAFYQSTDASIEAYIQEFHRLWGCHWFAYDQLITRAMAGVPASGLQVWDLDQTPSLTERLNAHFNLPDGTAAEVRNTRLPQVKIQFLRRFQQDFGHKIYDRNRPALIRRVNLSGSGYTPEQALLDGLDLPDSQLQQRFPQMQTHKLKALAMSGPR